MSKYVEKCSPINIQVVNNKSASINETIAELENIDTEDTLSIMTAKINNEVVDEEIKKIVINAGSLYPTTISLPERWIFVVEQTLKYFKGEQIIIVMS